MTDPGRLLLQVCANDLPPFVDICRYHEAAARHLGWQAATVMLARRASAPADGIDYLEDAGADALRRVVRQHIGDAGPGLVLCHRYRSWRTVVAAGIGGPATVVVAHEFGLLRRRRRRWLRHLDALRGRGGVRFAGVSGAVADDLAAAGAAASVLPNGIDLERADAERVGRAAALAALGLDGAEFNIGVVGRLHRKKQPELAIAGFRRAADAMPGSRLTLVGDGELRGTLAREAGDAPVRFAGFVAEAPRYFAAFDLLLLCAGAQEAFAMVALEAMAAGVPVLHGPSPGPEFVTAETGRRFAAAEPAAVAGALVEAYRDWRDGTLALAAAAARQRAAEHFSVTAGAARLLDLSRGPQLDRGPVAPPGGS